MSITFIGILSNMAGLNRFLIGRIQVFTDMQKMEFIRRHGVVTDSHVISGVNEQARCASYLSTSYIF